MFALVAELDPSHFDLVRLLFSRMWMHLAIESVLAGSTKAKMFVDYAEAPHAALTCLGHKVYLVGDVGGVGFGEVLGEFASRNKQFVAFCGPEAIDGDEKLLSSYPTQRRERLYYEGDSSRVNAIEPPQGYKVERISEELLDLSLVHTDWVREEMCSERESIEKYFENSFGFAAVHGEEFACWCISEYNLGDRCEVGVETIKEHRQKGLAVLVASTMFKHASRVGVRRIGWHCWADNAASVATAERLGLKRVTEYKVLAVDARPTL